MTQERTPGKGPAAESHEPSQGDPSGATAEHPAEEETRGESGVLGQESLRELATTPEHERPYGATLSYLLDGSPEKPRSISPESHGYRYSPGKRNHSEPSGLGRGEDPHRRPERSDTPSSQEDEDGADELADSFPVDGQVRLRRSNPIPTGKKQDRTGAWAFGSQALDPAKASTMSFVMITDEAGDSLVLAVWAYPKTHILVYLSALTDLR